MTIITFLIVLAVIGFVLWAIDFLPLDGTIKQLIRGVLIFIAVLLVVFFLLALAGITGGVNPFKLK